jgi:hypothetical protein
MPQKKTWVARLAKTLNRNLATLPTTRKIAYRVLSLFGAIDLLVRVWRVL